MAKSEGINKNQTVTTSELAGIIGLTPRRLQQLVADGVLEQEERGLFLLGESVQRYITLVKGEGKSEEERKIDLERKKAEARIKKARARREELSTAELEGSMFRLEDIEVFTNDLVFETKGMIMAFPHRLAVEVAAEDNPAVCAEIIKGECREMLTALSKYEFDPENYMDRVRERRKMELKFMQDNPEDDE